MKASDLRIDISYEKSVQFKSIEKWADEKKKKCVPLIFLVRIYFRLEYGTIVLKLNSMFRKYG